MLKKEKMKEYQKNRREKLKNEKLSDVVNMCENDLDGKRAYHWTFIIYPDSCSNNWYSILESLHCEFCISPLHDSDLNEDGSRKKAHYHVVLSFAGKKSYNQIWRISQECKGTEKVEIVGSMRRMVRYLCHLDNPEKYQYNVGDIENFGIKHFNEYLLSGDEQEEKVTRDIMEFLLEYKISELSVLWYYALNKNPLWFYHINANSSKYERIIKSLRHSLILPYNPLNGEIWSSAGKEAYIHDYDLDFRTYYLDILNYHMRFAICYWL